MLIFIANECLHNVMVDKRIITRRKLLGLAWCSRCKKEKTIHEFHKNAANKTYGVESYCKDCKGPVQKAQRNKGWQINPDTLRLKIRGRNLKRQFNIGIEQYSLMHQQQNGSCAICHKVETTKTPRGGKRMLSVDHCHSTGLIRGLLCNNCNKGLGCFSDDPKVMLAAISYLNRPK
jgi:Recombination endonuclease VII